MGALKKISLVATLLSAGTFATSCATNIYYTNLIDQRPPRLAEYDSLSNKLHGYSDLANAVELSRSNPTEWAQVQRDFDRYNSLQDTPEVKEALQQIDRARNIMGKLSAVVIGSLGVSFLSFLGYWGTWNKDS